MRRLAAIVLPVIGLAMLAFSVPVTADHWFATGDPEARINLLATCGGAIEYPANTPFFIRHGWGQEDWSTARPDERRGFMAPTTTFEFRLDRVPQPSALHAAYAEGIDVFFKTFVSEYHEGLTGTHRFGGLWFLDGSLVGEDFGEPIFQGGCVVDVTFV